MQTGDVDRKRGRGEVEEEEEEEEEEGGEEHPYFQQTKRPRLNNYPNNNNSSINNNTNTNTNNNNNNNNTSNIHSTQYSTATTASNSNYTLTGSSSSAGSGSIPKTAMRYAPPPSSAPSSSHPSHHHPHPHPHHPHIPLNQLQPKLELSCLMGLVPKNDLDDTIHKWAFDVLAKGKTVEIEGALGLLVKPILNEGSVEPEEKRIVEAYNFLSTTAIDRVKFDSYFVSGIKPNAFQHLNVLLNKWTSNSRLHANAKSKNEMIRGPPVPEIKYQRTFEIDKLYDNFVRVTLDVKEANKVKACIQKEKVDDLNIICPHSGYDIRLSAKMEKEVFEPKNQIVKLIRTKDRISYIFDDMFSVDLTTVHSYQSIKDPELVEKLRQILKNHSEKNTTEKLPKTNDCKITFEVEVEIYQKEGLYNRRQVFQKYLQNKHDTQFKTHPEEFKTIIRYLFQHIQHLSFLASNSQFTPPQCS